MTDNKSTPIAPIAVPVRFPKFSSRPPDKCTEKKFLTIRMTPDLEKMLDKVVEYYRSPHKSHAIRLMIEDTYRRYTANAGE